MQKIRNKFQFINKFQFFNLPCLIFKNSSLRHNVFKKRRIKKKFSLYSQSKEKAYFEMVKRSCEGREKKKKETENEFGQKERKLNLGSREHQVQIDCELISLSRYNGANILQPRKMARRREGESSFLRRKFVKFELAYQLFVKKVLLPTLFHYVMCLAQSHVHLLSKLTSLLNLKSVSSLKTDLDFVSVILLVRLIRFHGDTGKFFSNLINIVIQSR